MKVAAITGERQCELRDRPDPRARGEFVVVKIYTVPMCTEYKGYSAGHAWDSIGHEAAGEVVEVAQPGKVEVGDRVVVMPLYPCGLCALCLTGDYIHCESCLDPLKECGCEAGTATYAQYLLKQDWLLIPIPDDMSYEHASMACCGLGPTFGAMQLMRVDAFDTVLVTGMGPVGLGGIVNAVYRGARAIGVERHPYRAALAKKLGAATVLNPDDQDVLDQVRDLTDRLGVDKAIDCSGAPEAQRLLIDAARRKGHVAFVGEAGDLNIKVSNDMIRKGLTLHGAWHYNLGDVPRLMQVVRGSAELLDRMITHTFPMSEVQAAWELQLTGNCGKVILKPWE
ncbi:MAG: zinc-dependent alcohol dehydrogenase [Planctomycetota bacterium]